LGYPKTWSDRAKSLTLPRWFGWEAGLFLLAPQATSAVDEATEARLYRLVRDQLPRTTLFSVGHRATLRLFHDRQLFAQPDSDGPASIVEVMKTRMSV
jgi:putative ATP-binding cassette transporter